VKGVKEKQIDRRESADCAGRNEKEAGVKRALLIFDLTREPNGCDADTGCEKKHEQAQAVDPEREMNAPIRGDNDRADKLKTGCDLIEAAEKKERDEEIRNCRDQCGQSRGCAGDDQNRSRDWAEDKKEKHYGLE
jgi:hypothetical protein